jgi:F420-dependent oxidoreductase-like protein
MRIGVNVMDMTWPGGPAAIAPKAAGIIDRCEQAGIHSFWAMDHFFQVPPIAGSAVDEPVLEGWALLAWAAGRTRTIELGTLVTAAHFRYPGHLGKLATTFDVLSGGRSWLGIGAGWNEQECRGLGVPFPPLAERFERLEESLQILRQMFAGDASAFAGKHFRLERPLNVPGPIRRPPIMIAGGGERRTLRLVAEYGDACNLFDYEDVSHKLDVLRGHCADVGRPYDEIVKTTAGFLGEQRDLSAVTERLAGLAEIGIDLAILVPPDPFEQGLYDFLAELVRAVEPLGRPFPVPAQPEPAA